MEDNIKKIEKNNKINIKEEYEILKDIGGAPTLESKLLYYNCIECSSTMDIVSLNENEIEFKCKNKHQLKLKIKEY